MAFLHKEARNPSGAEGRSFRRQPNLPPPARDQGGGASLNFLPGSARLVFARNFTWGYLAHPFCAIF